MSNERLRYLQSRHYMKIVHHLWQWGAEETHDEYPELSEQQLNTANAYYDSKRCDGCSCGTCVELPTLAENLDTSPRECLPLAKLAQRMGEEEYRKSKVKGT